MQKDNAGVWSVTIGPMAPQLWGYWILWRDFLGDYAQLLFK